MKIKIEWVEIHREHKDSVFYKIVHKSKWIEPIV